MKFFQIVVLCNSNCGGWILIPNAKSNPLALQLFNNNFKIHSLYENLRVLWQEMREVCNDDNRGWLATIDSYEHNVKL